MKRNELELFRNITTDVFEKHSIGITISRYVTDITGAVIDKALLPANMQVDYPFFLLGEFDRQGGYYGGLRLNPPKGNAKYLTSFVNGNGFGYWSVVGFTGLSNIHNVLAVGDVVNVYTDDLTAPTYFIWLVTSYQSASIASILSNTKSTQKDSRIGKLYVESINFLSDNESQYSQNWKIINFDNIGLYNKNDWSPLANKYPFIKLTDILQLTINFVIDQYIEISSYLLFNTNTINLTLNIKKISNGKVN